MFISKNPLCLQKTLSTEDIGNLALYIFKSYLTASMGFKREALYAQKIPKERPIRTAKPKDRATIFVEKAKV